MGTPKTFKDSQGNGISSESFDSVEEFFEYVRSQSRKFDMAMRAARDEKIQESNHRRKQPVQGSVDEAIQSAEETLKKLQASYYPYWYANPPGHSGPVVTGWHLGFRGKTGDEPNEV